jgi:hypothetical protein
MCGVLPAVPYQDPVYPGAPTAARQSVMHRQLGAPHQEGTITVHLATEDTNQTTVLAALLLVGLTPATAPAAALSAVMSPVSALIQVYRVVRALAGTLPLSMGQPAIGNVHAAQLSAHTH